MKNRFLLAAFAISLAGCQSSEPLAPEAPPVNSGTRWMVRLRTAGFDGGNARESAEAAAREIQSDLGSEARIEPLVSGRALYHVSGVTEDIARRLAERADVESIEPDFEVHAFRDPRMDSQWHHAVVQSEAAWGSSQGEGITVAVIDSGTDASHADLTANVLPGWDFANNDGDPTADDAPHFHGTHVTGIIASVRDNGVGGVGVAPRVKILPLKFLSAQGTGQISHAIQAIYYAIDHGARIISNSWGGTQYSRELGDAIAAARDRGILFVAAAGNGGNDGRGDDNDQVPTYPASYNIENVVSVAAVNRASELTAFSNYGARTVHVAAPGEGILSTANGGSYQNMSGTSMATPIVSAIAALTWAQKPELSFRDVKNILVRTSTSTGSLAGRILSGGVVNAAAAVVAAGGSSPAPAPAPGPGPGPGPTPGPTPTPPLSEIAQTPWIGGQRVLHVSDPQLVLAFDYDVTVLPSAAGVYVEVTRPNQPFSNPNDVAPDPQRYWLGTNSGARARMSLLPARFLPGWGTYGFRVIAVDRRGQILGRFSDPATLVLQPGW